MSFLFHAKKSNRNFLSAWVPLAISALLALIASQAALAASPEAEQYFRSGLEGLEAPGESLSSCIQASNNSGNNTATVIEGIGAAFFGIPPSVLTATAAVSGVASLTAKPTDLAGELRERLYSTAFLPSFTQLENKQVTNTNQLFAEFSAQAEHILSDSKYPCLDKDGAMNDLKQLFARTVFSYMMAPDGTGGANGGHVNPLRFRSLSPED